LTHVRSGHYRYVSPTASRIGTAVMRVETPPRCGCRTVHDTSHASYSRHGMRGVADDGRIGHGGGSAAVRSRDKGSGTGDVRSSPLLLGPWTVHARSVLSVDRPIRQHSHTHGHDVSHRIVLSRSLRRIRPRRSVAVPRDTCIGTTRCHARIRHRGSNVRNGIPALTAVTAGHAPRRRRGNHGPPRIAQTSTLQSAR
jgi:hypothetical protein